MKKNLLVIVTVFCTFPLFGRANQPSEGNSQEKAKSSLVYIDVNISQPNVQDCYSGTSVDEFLDKKFFRIFPNPNRGQFTLEITQLKEGEQISVAVFNLGGKMLHQLFYQADGNLSNMIELNLAFLPKGVYFIHVQAKRGKGVQQLLIF
jgi:hypothetical protein